MPQNEENKNRPEDSDFKQQRLRAWQPILTPVWVIGTFLSVGVVFLAIGIAVLVASNSVAEQSSSDYSDQKPAASATCTQGAGSSGSSCLIDVEMLLNSDMDSPVYLYYELDNFYQNHRRYVKSRNDNQLMSPGDATQVSQCSPIDHPKSHPDAAIYPCGLIAWSVFNDTIYAKDTITNGESSGSYYYQNRLVVASQDGVPKLVSTKADGIAWSSDKDEKFEKLTKCSGNAAVRASTESPSIAMPYDNYKYYMCSDPSKEPCSTTSATGNTCFDYEPPPALGTPGAPKTTCPLAERCGDVSNEEFIVWMRTSGLPTFRKLHRIINTDLKKGETIKFTINNVFPVSSFSGSKKIVLSTTAWVGGKNTFLGAAYITVACICILLGVGFMVKELVSPRKKAFRVEDTSGLASGYEEAHS